MPAWARVTTTEFPATATDDGEISVATTDGGKVSIATTDGDEARRLPTVARVGDHRGVFDQMTIDVWLTRVLVWGRLRVTDELA